MQFIVLLKPYKEKSITSSFITIMHITVPYYGTVIHIFITEKAIAIQTITITKTLVTWCS